MSNLHNLLKAKQALEIAWRAVDDAIAAESISAAPQYDEPEQWIDIHAAWLMLGGKKTKRTLQRLGERNDPKDATEAEKAGVVKRGDSRCRYLFHAKRLREWEWPR